MILLLSGYDKPLPERGGASSGDRRRTPAPHSVSDVVRTGRRQHAARERHQAARGPRAVATTLRQHGAIVSAETLERPHPASSPAWHPVHYAGWTAMPGDAARDLFSEATTFLDPA